MGCISPSRNISDIPQSDKAQLQKVIVIEEIGTNDVENEISASEPDRLTIGPIKKANKKDSNISRKLSISISKILNPSKKYKHKSETIRPKYRNNGMYKSSSSELESEIKDASSTANTKYKSQKYHNYKGSTSDPLSLTEIKAINASDSDSDNDFESITKLTNMCSDTTINEDNVGSVTDNMSEQRNINNKISPRISLKLKQLIEPKYNPINKHYDAKWNVDNPFYHSDDGIEHDIDTTTENESYLSELSSIHNHNFYQLQSTKNTLNNNQYSNTPIPKSVKSKSNKSIMEIKPHRMGDKIKIKSSSKNEQQFYRIKQQQLPLKSPKRCRKKSAVSSSYNSLQAHHDVQSVIDRSSVRSMKSIRESNTNISNNVTINGIGMGVCDDDDDVESSSSNEFEDDAPIHNSIRSSNNTTNDRITNITNITGSNDAIISAKSVTSDTDGQPPPLPIKYLQTDSNKDSQFYQYTHYNYYYFDSNEKQKCYQIPLQRPCPPPHEFNAYSNKTNTITRTHTITCDNDNHGWTSDHSTHV